MDKMDDFEKDIAYSRTVKAGKRIYYLDVRRNRNNDEFYLSLTECKKKMTGSPENPEITYEKHKLFLYREDLSKFTEALIDVIRYINDHESKTDSQSGKVQHKDETVINEPPIKLDLTDFE